MMRLRRLACLALVTAAAGCLKENKLFDPYGSESGEGSAGATTDLTGGTGGSGCPALAPPSEQLETCELDSLSPFNVGVHPVFTADCNDVVTVWATRSVDTPNLVQVCDADCAACDGPNPIDLQDPAYSFLNVSNILAPAGECMKVAHTGELVDNVCRTTRLTLWSGADTAPRFAAGIDALDPLPGTGITLELAVDDSSLCTCSEADIAEELNGQPKYPCCAQFPVRAHDVLLTPDDGCPLRIRRGPANLTAFSTLGSRYDFILHNAYAYEGACGAARNTIYWTMTRAAG